MRRILLVLSVAALMATMIVATAMPAFAVANNPNAADAPGQAKAAENCGEVLGKQTSNRVRAGGGPKEGFLGPSNCDHYYQSTGRIGNQ